MDIEAEREIAMLDRTIAEVQRVQDEQDRISRLRNLSAMSDRDLKRIATVDIRNPEPAVYEEVLKRWVAEQNWIEEAARRMADFQPESERSAILEKMRRDLRDK